MSDYQHDLERHPSDGLVLTDNDRLPYKVAMDAYRHLSHWPDRQADAAACGYRALIITSFVDLVTQAEITPDAALATAVWREHWPILKEELLRRQIDILQLTSQQASPHVVGPANFPQRRQDGLRHRVDALNEAADDWRIKTIARLSKELRRATQGTPADQEQRRIATLERQLSDALALADETSADKKARILGFLQRAAQRGDERAVESGLALLRREAPQLFTSRHKIWKLPDMAIAAKIAIDTSREDACSEEPFAGGIIIDNPDADRTQIRFDVRPDAELIARLKAQGWRWSPSANFWQRMRTSAARQSARALLGIEDCSKGESTCR